jgi:hypothetical protein
MVLKKVVLALIQLQTIGSRFYERTDTSSSDSAPSYLTNAELFLN